MGTVLNFLAKVSGLGWVWEKLDGYKTYVGGASGVFLGAAGLLQEIVTLVDHKNYAEVLAWARALPHDQSILAILAGLAALGLRHSNQKLEDKVDAAQSPALPNQQ